MESTSSYANNPNHYKVGIDSSNLELTRTELAQIELPILSDLERLKRIALLARVIIIQ